LLSSLALPEARSHDIPNQRIDRSIQVTVRPGRIEIDYEVSLTELTLTQDLRALIGGIPGADRALWLARYGEVTGPLNRKGILVSIDAQPVELAERGFTLAVEEHPRYTFHFDARIRGEGRLAVHDTNYVSSEGTSRLAVRGREGVVISGDLLQSDVERIEIRPLWLLSDQEEQRTKQVEVRFHGAGALAIVGASKIPDQLDGADLTVLQKGPAPGQEAARSSGALSRMSQLLDDTTTSAWSILFAIAMGLGAVHAIQPGHGKTLVTAVALGPGTRLYQPALLGFVTALAHLGTVLLLAVALWYTGATRVATLHMGLAKIAGFVIAAAGFWRVGRHIAGWGEHEFEDMPAGVPGNQGLFSLGLAGGLVPCWDAVGLLVVAAAIGRLATGVKLVLAFSAGMAAVLVTVGCLAWKIKSAAVGGDGKSPWQRRLGLAAGVLISGMGLFLFLQS
jgi:ABC-type nickel/cobalt efflux system permease component RcnA